MKSSQRPNQPPLVSIVIPVFNKCDLTARCLKALADATDSIPHEVIVVDNASTDATPQRMQGQPPHVRYIRNAMNRNFAGACNQGAAAAAGKYLLFLNNDTVPLKGWLDALVDEVRAHPEVAAVGSKLLYESGLVQHAGVAFARETRSPFHPYRLLRGDDPRVNQRRELQAVTAACILIRPNWFKEHGGFNEEFQNGYEDLDLCLSIRKRGGIIVYQPKSVVLHLESQTQGRMTHDNENRALFFKRRANAVLSDEDAYYFADGYYLAGRRSGAAEQPLLMRFSDEAERGLWSSVAQSQALAAQGCREDLARVLADAAWPQEPAVRRWAGCLCRRLGLRDESRRHFEASLALEFNTETRILLAADSAEKPLGRDAKDGPFAAALEAGFAALRLGDFSAARNEFENALLNGAPPALALAGCWRADRNGGSAAGAEMARRALLALPRLDPDTAEQAQDNEPAAPDSKPSSLPAETPASPAPEPGMTSIIILVLNQIEDTRLCLESIAAHTPQPHEIIIVDNGSSDGTPEFLKHWQAAHPNCTVIRNATNRGFAAGSNQGLSIARGDQLLLLNNDTIVTDGWLKNMLAVFDRHRDAGVVGPVSNNVSGPQRVPQPGYQDRAALPEFAHKWSQANRGQSMETNRAVGFCLLARRCVLERLGGFDEQYGSGNFEDDDFCIRARLAGFRIRVAQDSFVHHTAGQTFKGAKIDYRQAMLRNWELFRAKWQLGAEASLEHGYPTPTALPAGTEIAVPLPCLTLTHQARGEKCWIERVRPVGPAGSRSAAKAGVESGSVPAVADIGSLAEARAMLGRRDLAAAWQSAVAALAARPFHPEAWLLLAEIALAAGDAAGARQCAQQARGLAPGWKAPAQFLQNAMKGNARPDWLRLPESISNTGSQPTSRLTVCLIVKNEEQFLARCLNSVKDIAGQIVVMDTGSADKSVEIAQGLGAEVHRFDWCDDFSAARNAALERATGDWVLILDADEELAAAEHARLRADMNNPKFIACRLPLVNEGQEAEGVSYIPRLFRNAPGAFFSGRIHEQVFPSLISLSKGWGLETGLGTARLLHHGYVKTLVKNRGKIERNLRLLKRAVEECPGDANLTMNLGLELVRSGDLAAGVSKYQEAFRLMSAQAGKVPAELREALLTQLTSKLYEMRDHRAVVQTLTSPLARHGGLTASLHFALGLAQFELKQYSEAAGHMRQCLARRKEPALSPINTDILTAAPHHCLALCLMKLGDASGADKAFQGALESDGKTAHARMDYARFLAEANRPVDALQRLHDVVAGDSTNAAAWRSGGEIALSRPEFLEFAGDWTAEAVRCSPEDAVVVAQRAEVLLLGEHTAEALPLWKKVCCAGRAPRALAALILCSAVECEAVPAALDGEEEAAVSQAFVQWYQRLLAFRAQKTLVRLNARLDAFRESLPTAARWLESALCEAQSQVA